MDTILVGTKTFDRQNDWWETSRMVEERVQRRLTAVMAADVVEYSRLMGEDEPRTLSRLKVVRRNVFEPKTKLHGGRIFKTTADVPLVEFSSAEAAVGSAIEVQRAMAEWGDHFPENERIALRIGVSLGDVMVEGDAICTVPPAASPS